MAFQIATRIAIAYALAVCSRTAKQASVRQLRALCGAINFSRTKTVDPVVCLASFNEQCTYANNSHIFH